MLRSPKFFETVNTKSYSKKCRVFSVRTEFERFGHVLLAVGDLNRYNMLYEQHTYEENPPDFYRP